MNKLNRPLATAADHQPASHKSHTPTPNNAPATPATRAFSIIPCAAPAEGLVDGTLLAVVGIVGNVTDGGGTDDNPEPEEERLMGGGTMVLLLTGTEVVKVVVRGGETEVTVEVIVV